MDDRIEDDEKEALAGLTSAPPRAQKIHSYSQQLRASSGQKRRHQVRKHSLDDIPKPIISTTSATEEHYYESSDDEFFPYSNTTNSAGGEEYVTQRLDQGLGLEIGPEELRQCQPLPEFIGSGGGSGIFKAPIRAAVHPGRPPFLELRPHPLRETQVGKFLRNIVCTDKQLWAGQESGVRVWRLEDAHEPGCGVGGKVRRGDEDAAPFHESGNMSPTMCLMVDYGNRLVWSGHKDGKIRSWKMDQTLEDNALIKEGLYWQAHKGPVLSMVMSSYGN